MTLKRTGFGPRTAPMRQSSIKRSPGAASGLLRVVAVQKQGKAPKATLKPKRPKMTPIRASAKGEACTLRFPCCNANPETTVWCHSNRAIDGKGMGIKARDEEGAYGCHACHSWLDGGYAGHMPRSLVDVYFDIGRAESQAILRRKGLIKSETATVAPEAASEHNHL